MKTLPLKTKFEVDRRGATPLKRGVTASFLLIAAGVAGALAYAAVCGRDSVCLSSFISWWVALSCCTGGLIAGLRGGPGVWWPAGQIGVLGGGLVLVLLALIAPESLGFGDLLTYALLPAGLSCAAALAGANLRATEAGRRKSGTGKNSPQKPEKARGRLQTTS
jgi:hypothetical protein